jgi:hypothetical protein
MTIGTWDFDDFTSSPNSRWEKFLELKQINPAFKVDLFCIPEGYGGCPDEFVTSLPDWVEVCLHGRHHTGHECEQWTKETTIELFKEYEQKPRWAHIFKAPGWWVSTGVMEACLERNWILAHTPEWKIKPIKGLRWYDHTLEGREHGHIAGCGNGIGQIWDYWSKRILDFTEFKFISEVVK